jgi:hypothetical protein
MTLTPITTEQCINKLQGYANTKVRSWNPFNLFRKSKLKNHKVASELAKILDQAIISDNDLLNLANCIEDFEDAELQHDLLCYLYSTINEGQKSFISKRKNINQISDILQNLIDKQYRPWWTLCLIKLPYYSNDFRNNLMVFIGTISDLFTNRRTEITEHLINVYSNDAIANQIISEYHTLGNPDTDTQDELNKILEISLDQSVDRTQKELIKEIKRNIITNLPFGKVLISTAGLSAIISSYLLKKENQTKPKTEQAQEIIYIIGKVFLKINAAQIIKSIIPGVGEIVRAVVSVVVSRSSPNPLHTDRQIGTAFASVAGGTVGGALGTIIPVIGTTIGAYIGAVISKTAATRFYQVLEAWQRAPKGPRSIIPRYPSSFIAFIDNDAQNILAPLYKHYLETEKKLKELGEEIAKWLCIYNTLVQDFGGSILDEHLEIVNEEMKRLQFEFTKLKDSHSRGAQSLYKMEPDNPARLKDYVATVKICLKPLQQPIIGMLNEYFSPTKVASPKTSSDSYTGMLRDLPNVGPTKSSSLPVKIKETNPRDWTKHLAVDDLVACPQFSEVLKSPSVS